MATRRLAVAVVANHGIRISYDVIGQGRPLRLLHGWDCDRSWWTGPGHVHEVSSDHFLVIVIVDVRGHGASDKPHDAAAYSSKVLTRDVFTGGRCRGSGAVRYRGNRRRS